MKRIATVGAVVATMSLAACSSAPDFPLPGDAEARAAYVAAYEADWFGNQNDEHLAEVPDHLRTAHQGMMNPGDEEAAAQTLKDTREIKVGTCEWTRYHPRRHRVEMRSRPRIKDKFTSGYLCDLMVFTKAQKGGTASAPARGFFFKDGETLSFAGEYAHAWQPQEQAASPNQSSTKTGGSWGAPSASRATTSFAGRETP